LQKHLNGPRHPPFRPQPRRHQWFTAPPTVSTTAARGPGLILLVCAPVEKPSPFLPPHTVLTLCSLCSSFMPPPLPTTPLVAAGPSPPSTSTISSPSTVLSSMSEATGCRAPSSSRADATLCHTRKFQILEFD
jgi:hypothetical protein